MLISFVIRITNHIETSKFLEVWTVFWHQSVTFSWHKFRNVSPCILLLYIARFAVASAGGRRSLWNFFFTLLYFTFHLRRSQILTSYIFIYMPAEYNPLFPQICPFSAKLSPLTFYLLLQSFRNNISSNLPLEDPLRSLFIILKQYLSQT